jgi:hypothetical protein
MAFIIPKITYPASAPTTTLNFTYPPTEKPGIPDQEGVSAVSKTLSGLKQTRWWREDEFIHLSMKNVPQADLPAWKAFLNYAHQGGSFLYYPDATDTATYDECWLEDSGGSSRSSGSGSSSDAWSPTYTARGLVQFELVLQKVPDGITAGAPESSGDTVTTGGVPTPPGGVVTVTPPPGPPPVPPGGGATEDMIDWIMMATGMGTPDRATDHLRGVNQKGETTLYYPYLDTTTSVHKVWQIKALTGVGVGNPADVLPFDATYVYHWITEIANRWSDPRAFKRINRAPGYPTAEGVPVMPRNFAPGAVGSPAAVTINSPKPNPQNDFINCVSQPAIELGDFQGVTHGLYSISYGSDLGTKDTIIVTVYRGTFGNFKVRENFYYVKFWGFVKWESQSLVSGVWTTTQFSVHNQVASGGGLTPNFPCGMSFPWWL